MPETKKDFNEEADALLDEQPRGREASSEEVEALLEEQETTALIKHPKEVWHKLFEAALFMSPNALAIADLMGIVGSEDYTAVKLSILDFLKKFNERNTALEVLQIDDSFKMQVKQEFETHVSNFAARALFHPGIMKTLALVAFKQPIMQSAVIKYRNNKAYDHIARLVEEGFIAREQKGKSFVLRTTKKFVEYFGKDFKKEQSKL